MTFRYRKDTLPNGLRVVTVETPHLHSAMVTVYVRVGSRHETVANNGVSHLLEHLFFRGSKKFPDTVRMNARVEAMGGNLNGVTMRDLSYYFTPVMPEGVGVALEVLGDLLTRPLLTRLELEKEIILEEILDEVDHDGRDIDLENLSKQQRFGDHPLGLKIAGTSKSVKGLSMPQVKEHFARHYTASNIVVAVAGPISRRTVLGQVKRAFRYLKPGAPVGEDAPSPPPVGPRLHYVEHDDAQVAFRLSWPTVSELHTDFVPLQVLRRVLDDGLSSRLPFNVVEKRGLAYSVGASVEAFRDTGAFEIDGATAPQKVGAAVKEILRTVKTLQRGEVTRDELLRARRRYRMAVEAQQDSPADLVAWFAGDELFRPPRSFQARCAEVEAITHGDLKRVAERWLEPSRVLAVAVGPREGKRPMERSIL